MLLLICLFIRVCMCLEAVYECGYNEFILENCVYHVK